MSEGRTRSPPTYQVFETKDGRLVNRTLQVTWPNHPIGNKKLFDGYILKEQSSLPEIEASSTALNQQQSTHSMMSETARDTTKFIGPATLATVNEKILLNDFIIFYALPDIKNATAEEGGDMDLPSKLPLLFAYRSSQGKCYYLPITRENHRWWIHFPNGNQKVCFSTMQSLIEHYYIYGFLNPKSGGVDIFRLNLVETASE